LQAEVKAYREYYRKAYAETGYAALDFAEWLLEHGGREPDVSELEEFDEDDASGPRPEGLEVKKRPQTHSTVGGFLLPPGFGKWIK